MTGDDDLFGDDFAADAPAVGAPSTASPGRTDREEKSATRAPRPPTDGGFMPTPIDFSPRDSAPDAIHRESLWRFM